ncbi:hypothetical protein ABKV19_027569, partial [Rosa sericea]
YAIDMLQLRSCRPSSQLVLEPKSRFCLMFVIRLLRVTSCCRVWLCMVGCVMHPSV